MRGGVESAPNVANGRRRDRKSASVVSRLKSTSGNKRPHYYLLRTRRAFRLRPATVLEFTRRPSRGRSSALPAWRLSLPRSLLINRDILLQRRLLYATEIFNRFDSGI